jgi:hypothetical protein
MQKYISSRLSKQKPENRNKVENWTSISMRWHIIVSAGDNPSLKKFDMTSSILLRKTGNLCSS